MTPAGKVCADTFRVFEGGRAPSHTCVICRREIHGAYEWVSTAKKRRAAACSQCLDRRTIVPDVQKVLSQFCRCETAKHDDPRFVREAGEQLVCFASQWAYNDGSVCVSGLTGAFKSFAFKALVSRWGAAVIAAGRMDQHFAGLVWAKATKLGECAKWHKFGTGGEPPEITRACDASVLMIDDLGQEAGGTEQTMFSILDERYDRGAPTLVNTGLTVEQLKSRYGSHFLRRLAEDRVGSLVDLHPRGKLQAVR